MAKKKTSAAAVAPETPVESDAIKELKLKNRHEVVLQVLYIIRVLGILGFIVVCVCWLAYYCVYMPILVSKGDTTIVTFAYSFVTDLKLHVIAPWLAAVVATIWGNNRNRTLRKERVSNQKIIDDLKGKISTEANSPSQGQPG
jgi:hypothetical protein